MNLQTTNVTHSTDGFYRKPQDNSLQRMKGIETSQNNQRSGFQINSPGKLSRYQKNNLNQLFSPKGNQEIIKSALYYQKSQQIQENWIDKIKKNKNLKIRREDSTNYNTQSPVNAITGISNESGTFDTKYEFEKYKKNEISKLSLSVDFANDNNFQTVLNQSHSGNNQMAPFQRAKNQTIQDIKQARSNADLSPMSIERNSPESKLRKQINFLPKISTKSKAFKIFSGSSIDDVYKLKSDQIDKLNQIISQISREKLSLETLNRQLLDKVVKLQDIVNKEASANTFYYNYPPSTINSGRQSPSNEMNYDSETAKIKKVYEDQMEQTKKQSDGEIRELKSSMSQEIEELQTAYSRTSRQHIRLIHEHEELDKKFKLYYMKSDKYIKDREAKLEQLQTECNNMADEYGRYDKKFMEERNNTAELKEQMKAVNQQFDVVDKLNGRLKMEIQDYEHRYKGIDVNKLHEQIRFLESQVTLAHVQEKSYEQDLLQLKERMLYIKMESDKFSKNLSPKKIKNKSKTWRGQDDIDQLTGFMKMLTALKQDKSIEQLEQEEKERIKKYEMVNRKIQNMQEYYESPEPGKTGNNERNLKTLQE